jgi:DNA polymerase-3 subunit gamma/tau
VDSRSFFSAFREVSSIFIGQGSFERARELVEVSRSLLRDIVILSADTPNDSLTNIDLLEWLVNFKPGKHILEDFVWCDSFLRQRTSSLSATLVSFRALYALSRSLVRRNNGGN